jgi:hypothetical protein
MKPQRDTMRRIAVRATANPYARYEAMKRELPPNLTPTEYAAACRALAKLAGI